ncbi:CASP-like protein UU1 [Physcomitrium patens]|uniref:CASP-like protein n=1 Tax=Physcomitrium patens TaxID=3218 RepID=A0A2K1JUH7_PHYPA|nr:CASP-like protein UU1 [Physcomitrium patens]PNR45181.1 hypothetical protein PHYPA_014952 [Physcomitrium patens]|eukprot:XP_024388263.1 CASP-like protein UU1 [Physcomitrella patens]
MEGGAWNSETFTNTKPAGTAGVHVPPAGSATPPLYHQPALGAGKELKAFGFATVGLRIAQFVFTLLGFAVMASNQATVYVEDLFTTEESTVKFSSIESFIGLLALDVIVCFYALVQLIHSIVWASSKGSFSSSATTGLAMITFLFDLVLAFALIAAGGAAADSTQIWSQEGLCDDTGIPKFCQKANASIVISFFAFAFLAFSCILYPLRLLRLAKQ